MSPSPTRTPSAAHDWTPAERDRALEEYHRTRDPELRAELVLAHEGLARAIAKRFAHSRDHAEDLDQAALIGLLHAIDRYRPGHGASFSTFAWSTISGELKRHLRDRSWGVRVPRSLKERYLAVARSIEELTHELGQSPTLVEVGERLSLGPEEVAEALEAGSAYELASLDAPAEGGTALGHLLSSDAEPLERAEDRQLLSDLLERLPDKEREMTCLRFFGEMSQSQIAARQGISQMQVSRVLNRALRRLQALAPVLADAH